MKIDFFFVFLSNIIQSIGTCVCVCVSVHIFGTRTKNKKDSVELFFIDWKEMGKKTPGFHLVFFCFFEWMKKKLERKKNSILLFMTAESSGVYQIDFIQRCDRDGLYISIICRINDVNIFDLIIN